MTHWNTLEDFAIGNRVELHPATDLWMRGARYGSVTKIGRTKITVKVDKIGREVAFLPSSLLIISIDELIALIGA